jgi:hypothetical protein
MPLAGNVQEMQPGGRVVFEGVSLARGAPQLANRLISAAAGCKEFLDLRPYRR